MPDDVNAIAPTPAPQEYATVMEMTNAITEKAAREAIRALGLFAGAKVLDVPCGIGNHSMWMVEENATISVLGVDISEAHLARARELAARKGVKGNLVFEKGDIQSLAYEDDAFDFVWCCDGLWIGGPESGSVAQEPYAILGELMRVVRPGGKIALLFWTGQRLLPGYPLLESALGATWAANAPMSREVSPEFHAMRAPLWLKKAGCRNVQANSFVADVRGPFSEKDVTAMLSTMTMFWECAEAEVSPELWAQYTAITDPDSDAFILRQEGYAGFIVYTMFTGTVP